ncbi:MAG: hypothetical protein ACRBBP_07410 [Bdellovibrionales bacterium]
MKPKILYICPGSFGETHGVIQKVTRRVEYWNTQGFETKIVTYKDIHFNFFQKILLRLPLPPLHAIIYFIKFPLCVKDIQKKFKADIIYTRHFPTPFLMPKDAKLILEVNGRVLNFAPKTSLLLKTLLRKSVDYYNKNCVGLVIVGEGLESCFTVKNFITIPNSILETSDIVLENFVKRAQKKASILRERKVVFLATKNRAYYSLNSVMKMLSKLEKPIKLTVIGPIRVNEERIPEDLDIEFCGSLYGEELSKELSSALIGFGVLSAGAVLNSKASPLKTRSYLQHALPVYTENNDTDYITPSPFFFGTDQSDSKSLQAYANELNTFIDNVEQNSFTPHESLPPEIYKTCLDQRENKTLTFFLEDI